MYRLLRRGGQLRSPNRKAKKAAKLWEGDDRANDSGARRMSAHALYVTAAYGITAIVLAGLIGWILLDQRGRKRELAELEAAGVRRRSDKTGKGIGKA